VRVKLRRAIALAVAAIDAERQKYAFEANVHKRGIGGVGHERAAARYDALIEAREVLLSLMPNGARESNG
jgi:hypothetical protein